MPSGEAEFAAFADVFTAAAEETAELLGIPAATVTELKALNTSYQAAFKACESPNAGKLDREDRAEKRAALDHRIRKVKNVYIDGDPNNVVTNEIRIRYGLPPKDATITIVDVPREIPSFTLESGGYLMVTVKHPARPPRCNGAVLFYRVSAEPVTAHSELTSTKLLTRRNETLVFSDSDRLKTMYAALAWQNEKGQLGPSSPIQSIVIV
jgi:hypothetical protein